MYITKLSINNYKCFLDTGEFELDLNFSIAIGQNNSGKTSLLEVLSSIFQNKPHRTINTSKRHNQIENGHSSADITFYFSKEDISFQIDSYFVNNDELLFRTELTNEANLPQDFLYYLNNGCEITYTIFGNGNTIPKKISNKELSSNAKRYRRLNESEYFYNGDLRQNEIHSVIHKSFEMILFQQVRNKIFSFKAERMNLHQSAISVGSKLEGNAINLPSVLNFLHTNNPRRFDRISKSINKVIPNVKGITIPPINGNQTQIMVWGEDPNSERDDLAIPLNECGTGISQVLSILYVAINSDTPQIILIDEPQSFLHPEAVKTLLDILKKNPVKHQYILTTHSPTVINKLFPCRILHVQQENRVSTIKSFSPKETTDLRMVLNDVGASLSDVFGAEKIIWVEGKTEEMCFRLISDKLLEQPIWGTEILGVKQVGDLTGKQAKNAYDIYNRLSTGRSILPPAVAFIFDREGRKLQEITDLERESNGKVKFLERKMYENYLINTEAIAFVFNESKKDGQQINAGVVQGWIEEKGSEKNFDVRNQVVFSDEWFKHVHGAKLLEEIFKEFSENKLAYHKTTHGFALTEWLIENQPEALIDIKFLLEKIQ